MEDCSIFDSGWRNEVSNFRLRKFAQVGTFCDLYRWHGHKHFSNLFYVPKISKILTVLTVFHPIWVKFYMGDNIGQRITDCVWNAQSNRSTEAEQWQIFTTSAFFSLFWLDMIWKIILGYKQHRLSLKWLRLFFDWPDQPTKADRYQIFKTSMFFVQFGWNLVCGQLLGKKQHRMSLR